MKIRVLVAVVAVALALIGPPRAYADDICTEAAGGECEAAQELTDMADDTPTVPDEVVDEAQEAIDTQEDNVND